jgi:probable HAF family extracellular repeat protein
VVNPFGANNRGEIIGNASFADEATSAPFLWSKGDFIDLGTFGGTFGEASSINDAGAITGHAATPDPAVHGFLWKKGVLTDIGTVDGDDCSAGFSINLAKQIVGQSFACDGSVSHAFLWENGRIVDLNSLISTDPTCSCKWWAPSITTEKSQVSGYCPTATGTPSCWSRVTTSILASRAATTA